MFAGFPATFSCDAQCFREIYNVKPISRQHRFPLAPLHQTREMGTSNCMFSFWLTARIPKRVTAHCLPNQKISRCRGVSRRSFNASPALKMTLLAAATAWFAVQGTDRRAKEIASLTETETCEIMRGDLIELVNRINVFWMSVDQALRLGKNESIRAWRQTSVIEYFYELPNAIEIEQLGEMRGFLSVCPKSS